jgi:hypothetical protein
VADDIDQRLTDDQDGHGPSVSGGRRDRVADEVDRGGRRMDDQQWWNGSG